MPLADLTRQLLIHPSATRRRRGDDGVNLTDKRRVRSASLTVPGVVASNSEPSLYAEWGVAEPGYFATMRIPLMKGRDFSVADRNRTQPVAIVAETVADGSGRARIRLASISCFRRVARIDRPDAECGHRWHVLSESRGTLNHRGLGGSSTSCGVFAAPEQYSAQVTVVARTTQGQGATRDIRAVVASINSNPPIVMTQTLEDRQA